MVNKSILSKNYYIAPVVVSDFGADVYNVMAEADRAMEEASEIIAEIASLTERVPSEIRCGALQEACATAQAEIKSVDFLSYGQRVDQGLQNLLDHNQYITDHFIKNMGMHTERMRGLGEEFRRLADLITYSGEGVQLEGTKLSPDGNLETINADSEEENASIPGQDDILEYFSSYDKIETETITAIRLLDTQVYNRLGITEIEKRQNIIQTILDERPYVLNNLYILNIYSGVDYQKQMSYVLHYINYVYMVNQVGEWYATNISTYCSLNQQEYDDVIVTQGKLRNAGYDSGDSEWVSTLDRGRQGYVCTLAGNLNGITVCDDCSSFVTACLIQSGLLEYTNTTKWYNSYDYIPARSGLPSGSSGAEQALIDAGFVWYPVSEMTEEEQRNLQQGDIMVREGHVQIFDSYDAKENDGNNPTIYAYSWGEIYESEPARSCRTNTFIQTYEGIWRLEN